MFSLPLKGSEGISESLLLFLVHGTEFRVVFSSAEGFGTEFRKFLSRGTAGIPSEITICSVYSVFRGIIFLSEIPNPKYSTVQESSRSSQYRGAFIAPLPTDNDDILIVKISLCHWLQVPNLFIAPLQQLYTYSNKRPHRRQICVRYWQLGS